MKTKHLKYSFNIYLTFIADMVKMLEQPVSPSEWRKYQYEATLEFISWLNEDAIAALVGNDKYEHYKNILRRVEHEPEKLKKLYTHLNMEMYNTSSRETRSCSGGVVTVYKYEIGEPIFGKLVEGPERTY